MRDPFTFVLVNKHARPSRAVQSTRLGIETRIELIWERVEDARADAQKILEACDEFEQARKEARAKVPVE